MSGRYFQIHARAKPKERPRFSGHGYTPKATRDYEAVVKNAYLNKFSEAKPYDCAVGLDVIVHFCMPKSWSGKRREMCWHKPMPGRPDFDNLAKIVTDALNTVAYTDDALIARFSFQKIWDTEDFTEVVISELAQ